MGIEKDKISNIFANDIQKIKRGTFNEKGTGVGLLICKNLCNVLGIQLEVKSIPLVETRFTLIIKMK
jgi:signal transduction histidine kinase